VLVLVAGRRIRRRAAQDVRGRALERVGAHGVQCLRHGQDVGSFVAVRRERDRFTGEFEIPQVDAHRQDVDLPARIVDVELANQIVAGGREQVAERRAVGGEAAVAHVHGAGGIGRDEFDHDLAAAAHLAAAVRLAQRGHRPEFGEPGVFRQAEIDEAGAGDFRAGDQAVHGQGLDNRLRQVARVLAGGLGQAHGNVAGEVAVQGVARALDHHLGGIGGVRQYGGYK